MTVIQYFEVQTMSSTYVPNNRGAEIIRVFQIIVYSLIGKELFEIYI